MKRDKNDLLHQVCFDHDSLKMKTPAFREVGKPGFQIAMLRKFDEEETHTVAQYQKQRIKETANKREKAVYFKQRQSQTHSRQIAEERRLRAAIG